MKGAAALALGGVAVGNLGAYLPALLTAVRGAVSFVCMPSSCGAVRSLVCHLHSIVMIRCFSHLHEDALLCRISCSHELRPSEVNHEDIAQS